MTEALSPNTQALLLLTAPLLTGRGTVSPDLLDLDEYNRLAHQLREAGMQPSDLLTTGAVHVCEGRQEAPDDTDAGQAPLDTTRLERLLGRGFQLSQAVDHWQTRALWVMSRADDAYPRRLRARLKHQAPVVLYGCGDRGLLNAGGLAITGSHKLGEAEEQFAQGVGVLAAAAEVPVIVSGILGAHEAALRGVFDGGGTAVAVLTDNLERAALERMFRGPLLGGQLTMVSPHDPRAAPSADRALLCSHAVYALADAGLVVSAGLGKGVPWAGALHALEQPEHPPLFVRVAEKPDKALAALQDKGAQPWPEALDVAGLRALLGGKPPKPPGRPGQGRLHFGG